MKNSCMKSALTAIAAGFAALAVFDLLAIFLFRERVKILESGYLSGHRIIPDRPFF